MSLSTSNMEHYLPYKVLQGAIGAQAPMIDRQTYERTEQSIEVMRLKRINDCRMKRTTTTLV